MSQPSHNPLSFLKSPLANSSSSSIESASPTSRSPSNNLFRAMSHHGHGSPTSPSPSTPKRGASEGLLSRFPSLHLPEQASPKLPAEKVSHNCKIADFDIQSTPIGYGSSAVVFAATFKPRDLKVALKIIDLDMYEPDQIDKLRSETALMALSKHPNLLRIYSTFAHDAKLYIVTPFLAGGSCLDIMKVGFLDGFEEAAIATILKQALQGLAYLHNHDNIHRDVKAGNLLMDEDGTVVLADFGVSRSLTERNESRRTFVGTPCWMAPEVMEQKAYSYKADIWSFGITAFELATGHAPLSKYPPLKVIMMTLRDASPSLDRVETLHRYSKSLKDMIDQCLHKDATKRPSAEQLLQHSFFKQAKEKEYLVKHVLSAIPSLDNRPHKKVPLKKTIVSEDDSLDDARQQWDFGDVPTPLQPPAKHISFGDVVVNSPLSTATPELLAPTPQRKSRFVIEDNREGDQHNTVSSIRSVSSMQSESSVAPTGSDGKDCLSTQEREIRKGRFSVNQQSTHARSVPSVSDSNEPTSATVHDVPGERKVKFDSLPLSRESSNPRCGTLSRNGSISKASRFSVGKDEGSHAPNESQTPVHTEAGECWKKGRFQLTGSSVPSSTADLRGLDSPQSTLSAGSAVSMSASATHGPIRVDPYASQLVYSHMENLLRQTETQRALLHELLTGMALTQSSVGVSALPPHTRARAVSADTKRAPLVPDEWSRSTGGSEIGQTVEHLQQLVLSSTREHERLTRENEALKREVERLRSCQGAGPSQAGSKANDVADPTSVTRPSTADPALGVEKTATNASAKAAPEAAPPTTTTPAGSPPPATAQDDQTAGPP